MMVTPWKALLSVAEVRRLLEYDASTGLLTWGAGAPAFRRGLPAGGFDHDGYRRVVMRGREYRAHRVAWAIHYGKWPERMIDHINGDVADNRIDNLREADNSQNQANRHKLKDMSRRGITWHRKCKKWQAIVKLNGKNHYLGLFNSVEAAQEAYNAKARELFGEYAWRAAA